MHAIPTENKRTMLKYLQMKIAIIGQDNEKNAKLVKDVLTNWGGAFATPQKTIFDETVEWTENSGKTEQEAVEEFGEYGAELYNRMLLLSKQYEEYKEVKNIIYNGSTLDLLANALFLYENGLVDDKLVEKMIYWNKVLISKLDLIYILPPKHDKEDTAAATEGEKENTEEKKATEERELTDEEKENKRLEEIYFSLWLQYTDDFEKSEIFPHKDCPGIVTFETENPIEEMKMIVDKSGNLTSDESPEEVQKLYDSIKDPRLLKNVKDIMEKPSIPLIGTPDSQTILI